MIVGTPQADLIAGDTSSETLIGGAGNDVLSGNNGNDTLLGLEGDDVILGGEGQDLLRGWLGADRLFGGRGNDRVSGGPDGDLVVGNRGHDVLKGKGGIDFLRAKDGTRDYRIKCGPGPTGPRAPRATSAWIRAPAPAERRGGVLRAGDHARVHRIHYHFGIVLALILVSIGFQLAAGESDFSRLAAVVLQALTLVAAVVASRAHPFVIRLAVIAAVLSVVGASLAILGTAEFGNSSGRGVTLLLVALVPPAIVTGLIKLFREEGSVTVETMFGGLCLYLIVGLFFGTAFAAIEEIGGHAVLPSADGRAIRDERLSVLQLHHADDRRLWRSDRGDELRPLAGHHGGPDRPDLSGDAWSR